MEVYLREVNRVPTRFSSTRQSWSKSHSVRVMDGDPKTTVVVMVSCCQWLGRQTFSCTNVPYHCEVENRSRIKRSCLGFLSVWSPESRRFRRWYSSCKIKPRDWKVLYQSSSFRLVLSSPRCNPLPSTDVCPTDTPFSPLSVMFFEYILDLGHFYILLSDPSKSNLG